MGSKVFQEQYIEYLEEYNTALQNKLVQIKESKNKLLNKELRNKYSETALKELTTICNSTCEAIDNFFENFKATMDSFQNVLLWKSQIAQIPKKLSFLIDSTEGDNESVSLNGDIQNFHVNEFPKSTVVKKNPLLKLRTVGSTAKVSPMIKGHVISTPTIHLNRVSNDIGSPGVRPMTSTLSPIIETSPEIAQANPRPTFRDVRIPLRRLPDTEISGRVCLPEESYNIKTSPRINFFRRKPGSFVLRKHFGPLTENNQLRLLQRREVNKKVDRQNKDNADTTNEGDTSRRNVNINVEANESTENQGRETVNDFDADPMEGPSWLLDQQEGMQESINTRDSPSNYRFINMKRSNNSSFRKNSDLNHEKSLILNGDASMDDNESNKNVSQDSNSEKDESNMSVPSEQYSSTSPDKTFNPKGSQNTVASFPENKILPIASCEKRKSKKRLYSPRISLRGNSFPIPSPEVDKARKSKTERNSGNGTKAMNGRISNNKILKILSQSPSKNICVVNLNRVSKFSTPKKRGVNTSNDSPSSSKTSKQKPSSLSLIARDEESPRNSNESNSARKNIRSKRRAAISCIEKKKWLENSNEAAYFKKLNAKNKRKQIKKKK